MLVDPRQQLVGADNPRRLDQPLVQSVRVRSADLEHPTVMTYNDVVGHVVRGIEGVGTAIMTLGGAFVLLRYAGALVSGRFDDQDYRRLRSNLGRVILVGLEVLIVADIVRTIIVEASLSSVAVLGTIVLIRTVLSVSLDIEIDGSLPWRQRPADPQVARPASDTGGK